MKSKVYIPSWMRKAVIALLLVAGVAACWLAIQNLQSPKRNARNPKEPARLIPAQSKDAELPATPSEVARFLESPDRKLSPQLIQKALNYLKSPTLADSAEDPAAEYFNNVIALLLAQPEQVVGFSDTLLGVVNDEKMSFTLRNYAMQHLYHAWLREKDTKIRQDIENCLRLNMENATSSLQGVAIITFSRFYDATVVPKGPNGEKLTPISIGDVSLAEKRSMNTRTNVSEDLFVANALRVIEDSTAQVNSRTCAFSALLRLENYQAVHAARKVLRDSGVPDEVRCAAIASIGAFGNLDNDQVLLNSIPAKPESVRKAADYALLHLQKSRQKS